MLAAVCALLVACADGESAADHSAAGSSGSHPGASGGSASDGGASAAAGREQTGGAAGSGDGPSPRGACPAAKRLGRFAVERQKDFGVVQGTILDGVVPTSVPELVEEQDGCSLLRRRNLSCSPACTSSETCGEKGKCIAYPRQISVGTVTIDGLTKKVTMEAQQPGAVYFAPGQDNPPFLPTAVVQLEAAGAASIDAFELFGRGSKPVAEPSVWLLEQDKPLELTWLAGTDATTIGVELTIDQHGSSPLSLSCEFPDGGTGRIPATLVNQLITSGVSGFPNGRFVRHSVDHVEVERGCIELSVGSALAARVRVAGFTPCKTSADCPSGTTCDVAQERCF